MLRALLASFLFSFSLLLAACGDNAAPGAPGSPPPAASASAGSNVVKGLIRNGVVSAWRWQDGAYVQVASARTGADGSFVLTVSAPVPGEVLRLQLDVSADTSPGQRTEMLCDVAQCGSNVRGDWVPLATGLGLSSWASVGADGSLTLMPMTPLSTLVVSHAENLGGGHLTAASLEVARARVAALVGLTPQQLLARPGNILDTAWLDVASPESVKVSVVAAAMAELSTLSGQTIDSVLAYLAERFNAHDGHLLQAGELGSQSDLFQAVASLAATNPDVQAHVQAWVTAVLSGLQSGQLSTSACAPSCGPFDSGAVIAALGTGSDTLGGDLQRLMQEQGVTRIEDLIAAQLARYGWLAHPDTEALAGLVYNVAGTSAISAIGLGDYAPPGLTVTRNGNVLHLEGMSSYGFAVNLDVTIPDLMQQIRDWAPGQPAVFVIGAKGYVQNDRIRGRIDGTLTIDASATDFGPLKTAVVTLVTGLQLGDQATVDAAKISVLQAAAGILRTGGATFTLDGSAALAKLELQGDVLAETSLLAISGLGQLTVDMDGLDGGGILAQGHADHGTLTLPSGDTFSIDPGQGQSLTFALGTDGTASLAIGAHVLGHDAAVSGAGKLANLGLLLSHARDNLATMLDTATLDFSTALSQLLTDLRTVTLTLAGTAVIPDYNHTYTLAMANRIITLSQPDSSTTALQLALLARGVMAQAGDKWWLLGVDLSVPSYPALLLSDSTGGEWRWDFNFSGLVALAGGTP